MNLKSLEGIEAFSVTRLDILLCSNLKDASQIASLSELESLKIADCIGISDVSFLSQLSNLKTVKLWHTSVAPKTLQRLPATVSVDLFTTR